MKREIERRQAGASGARGIVVPEAGCERKVLCQISARGICERGSMVDMVERREDLEGVCLASPRSGYAGLRSEGG